MAEWWEGAPAVEASAPKKGGWWEDSPMVDVPPLPEGKKQDKSYKGALIPFSVDAEGNKSFDITAGIPGAIIDAFKLPGDALQGKAGNFIPSEMTQEEGLRVANLGGMGVTKPIANIAGKGVSSVTEIAKNYLAQPDNALTGISKKAVAYARATFEDPSKQAEFIRELQRLGPEATLADVSPEWMGVARGAASRPGQRDSIVQPLLDRDASRNQRLGGDLDRALGPAQTPSRIETGLAANREALSPEYVRSFQGARAVDTQELAARLDELAINLRGPGQTNARRVREMLNIPGQDVLDPHPGALHETRKAIDGMRKDETNPEVIRVLDNARRQVDETLAAAVPGVKDVDAKFSELMRQSEGLERGRDILDSGKTALRPDEFREDFAGAALPEGNMVGPSGAPLRIQQGIRARIDNVVGNNSNDPLALQRLVKGEGDWNRDKLRTAFGDGPADDALNAIDREALFSRTSGRVTSGSDTAMAQRFGDFLDDAATPSAIPTDTTITGALARGGQKAVQTLSRTNSEKKAERFASELGRLAVARGPERDRIVLSLQAAIVARQKQGLATDALESMLRTLGPGEAADQMARAQRRLPTP